MNKLVTLPYVSSAFNFRSFTKIIVEHKSPAISLFFEFDGKDEDSEDQGSMDRSFFDTYLESKSWIRSESVQDYSKFSGPCPSRS